MRLGSWAARIFPSMQHTRVPYEGTWINLDLRRIDHQTTFFDGTLVCESDELKLLEGIVPVGGTAIDVGANLGLYTIPLARLVGQTGRVISYEPEAENLLTNTAAFSQVLVRAVAVADKEEEVMWRSHRSSSLSRIVPKGGAKFRDTQTKAVTIDAEVARLNLANVDFLKIDVEGGEAGVLAGARRLVSAEPTPVIMFEWIPDFRTRSEKSAFTVLKENVGAGWRLFRVGWDWPIAELHNFAEPAANANIFAFPPSRSLALNKFLESSQLRS
jgi:FkbM family methyltransferase